MTSKIASQKTVAFVLSTEPALPEKSCCHVTRMLQRDTISLCHFSFYCLDDDHHQKHLWVRKGDIHILSPLRETKAMLEGGGQKEHCILACTPGLLSLPSYTIWDLRPECGTAPKDLGPLTSI